MTASDMTDSLLVDIVSLRIMTERSFVNHQAGQRRRQRYHGRVHPLWRNPLTEYALFLANWTRARLRFPTLTQHYLSMLLDSTVEPRVTLYARAQLHDCHVGAYSYVGAEASLAHARVGRFCSIGPRCLVGPGSHPSDTFVSTHPAFYSTMRQAGVTFVERDRFAERLPVTIGHDVWLGAHAVVLDGARIGDGAIVAAGAVVHGEVAPYTIVGGVPAKPLRKRFDDETITWLRALAWWDRDEAWLRAHAPEFADAAALRRRLDGRAAADGPLPLKRAT
jgi:acetyltransferase-like isoleucine patch superfamily enzyme